MMVDLVLHLTEFENSSMDTVGQKDPSDCGPSLCLRCVGVGHHRHAGVHGHAKPRHQLGHAQERERDRLQGPATAAHLPSSSSSSPAPTVPADAPSTPELPSAEAAQGAVVSRVPQGEEQPAARGEQRRQEEGENRGGPARQYPFVLSSF